MTPQPPDLQQRMERIENAIVEIREIMRWLAKDDTWQSPWDKLDEICKEIETELAKGEEIG